MRRVVLQMCQATLKKGRPHGAVKVGTLLFPGYSSERAIVIFMCCEVGTFSAAGRVSSQDTCKCFASQHEQEWEQSKSHCLLTVNVPGNGGTL